jgi:hypothetical protein
VQRREWQLGEVTIPELTAQFSDAKYLLKNKY